AGVAFSSSELLSGLPRCRQAPGRVRGSNRPLYVWQRPWVQRGRIDSAARSNLLPKPLDLGGEAPHPITGLVDGPGLTLDGSGRSRLRAEAPVLVHDHCLGLVGDQRSAAVVPPKWLARTVRRMSI